MSKHQLALIIPTKDRPALLGRLLQSLARQPRHPTQVIIVDGGTVGLESRLANFSSLPIHYIKMQPPSLTRQKNRGQRALQPQVSLVGFLDDDLELEEGALEAMRAFWDKADPGVGGAGFLIQPEPPLRGMWLKRLFELDAPGQGRLLRSSYNTPLRATPQACPVQWLPGGASIWRREVVEVFRFDEWLTGYSYLEDIDFSIRVNRHYQLMLVPTARARHESAPWTARQHFRFGIWQIHHRLYLTQKHHELSTGRCLWALVGQTLLNATRGIARWESGSLSRVGGNLLGWLSLPQWLWKSRQYAERTVRLKRDTAGRFGYLWAQERSDPTPRTYHYERSVKPALPPRHLRGWVLDAGCGSGIDALQMAQGTGCEVVAVELSRQGIEQTRARTKLLPNVIPIQGDVEALSFKDDSFDFIYSYGVLHHLPNPDQGFRELVRVLKPGGWLAIYVYEDFSTRSRVERALLGLVGLVRRLTVRIPEAPLYRLCWACAPGVFLMFTIPARLLALWPVTYPLSQRIPFRHGRSSFGLTGDLYDRFAAPLERRYSRHDVEQWFISARLQQVAVVPQRGWIACGQKPAGGSLAQADG